jgi:hypothetical protein
MTTVVRYATVTNTTGAALTSALLVDGKEYALRSVKRTFVAADIGAGAGQTQHANGCLIAQFSGCFIKDVVHFSMFRDLSADGFLDILDGFHNVANVAHLFQVGWKIGTDGQSLYLRDAGNNAATQLVAADILQVLVLTGNS